MTYFNNHNHTCYSNLRLVDSISQPKDLINRAVELGLSGIAITDHESLGSHVEVNLFAKELRKTNPNFTVALGNEIYLTDTRDKGQRYYHFILIAKDEIGYRGIKEFSSIAWLNGYFDRGMERVPLLKSELAERMSLYKGHIIATTACIGGELGQLILASREDPDKIFDAHDFVDWCIDVFGKDDFYVEIPPSANPEQLYVNKRLKKIADRSGLKMCVATDSHYLSKEDRYVHKAYLNSKNGEREVDAFYEYARLMTVDETTELLSLVFDQETIESIYENSEGMRKSIQWFSLEKHPSVPEVEVSNYVKVNREDLNDYPTLKDLFKSDNAQERYWVNECFKGFDREHIDWKTDTVYINELEEEARVKRVLGDKLQTCMFAYPNTLKHYIDLFWECGSTVGAGRGSSCAALNHYLLGVTQLDPVKEDLLFFWRYLNTDRVELGMLYCSVVNKECEPAQGCPKG